MTRLARIALLAVSVAALPVASASLGAQSAKPTVAIMYFNNNVFTKDARDYDGLSKGVPDFLITEMSANSGIRVVERDQVQKLIDEQKLVGGGQVDAGTAARVGKLLGVQHMIFGGFMADPKGNFRIDARAVNVETGVIEYTERVQDKSDNVMALIGTLATKLNSGLKLPAMPMRTGDAGSAPGPQQAGSPSSTKLPMRVAVMYGKALDMADKGDTTHAVELFSAVLKEFPDYAPAKNGMAKVKPGS
ncbi:MAG TPA: CsgG/HfaB family protein [Gemmatimonadaceae bacterium]|nr:CsgG/HfaB family protein [Gemmatimonadaceae bacterium]